MWDKLLSLFKEQPLSEEVRRVVPHVEKSVGESPAPQVMKTEGPSTHIGFNYLKGMDDEDTTTRSRRFINLNRLLRGDYDGQIAETTTKPQGNLRREDSE